ncbi:4Fe-4S dicluster domain-containing protein [Pseudodesulfovibrio piezophilus]|uniref:Carbon monoxide-induced hydrogenase, CooX subunit n=1 Tax=Pseudodesulfovibrio piezophilus (strain DSM 21447 / JCM 15486 / C1TLV30) TaxID=1322246 RepID=M1WYB7_PSEP2|nr:4Fe-4S dicluster-binding protein [Pseudodesulfovibrio piezophilus]CCH50258.1 Carbon monoxide-induced hydrogenase, CooX subunit [Pseudodesulfovibrio piezophilus C1TLV30]
MFPFLKILVSNLLKGPSTEPFPLGEAHTPTRFRGRAELDPNLCLTCGICRHVCAGGAIDLTESTSGNGVEFRLWHNTCTFCGLCEHYCPTKAIRMTQDWHLAHAQEEKYTCCETRFVEYPTCLECGERMLPTLGKKLHTHAIGSVDAASIMQTCPTCRRKISARHQAQSTRLAFMDRR